MKTNKNKLDFKTYIYSENLCSVVIDSMQILDVLWKLLQ